MMEIGRDPQPILAIRCLTYNHGKYIRQCLEGFVMQKTTFPFIAIVHDDASTDDTPEIIKEYEKRYPNIIKPIYEAENQYSKRNGSIDKCLEEATPESVKYIAICEGDDYWIDPNKLQKQVDFLERHPEYGLIHTNFKTKTDRDVVQRRKLLRIKSGNVFKPLIYGTYKSIGTLTVVYRKDLYDRIPKVFETKKYKMGDYPLFIEMSYYSKFKYLKHPTAVYRILQNSASHKTDPIEQIQFLENHHQCRLDYIKYFNIKVKEKKLLSILYNNIISTFYHKDIKSIYIEEYFKKILHLGYSYIKMRSLIIFICHKSPFISRLVSRVI